MPAACSSGRLCERQIHTLSTDDLDNDVDASALDEANARRTKGGHEGEESEGKEKVLPYAPSREGRGSGVGSSRPTTPNKRKEEDWRGEDGGRGGNVNRKSGDRKNRAELDLPPRHWMCTVCKKVRRCSPCLPGYFPSCCVPDFMRSSLSLQLLYNYRVK